MKGITMGKVVEMCDGCNVNPVDFFIESEQKQRLNLCADCGLKLHDALCEKYKNKTMKDAHIYELCRIS